MRIALRDNSGFTMVELLIAAVLGSIVTFAAMDAYLTQHRQFLIQEQVADMQQRGRAALDDISFNLRQSGFNTPDSIDGYRIAAVGGSSDTVEINHHGDNILFYVDNSDTSHPNLMKEVNGDAEIFADEIDGLEATVLASDLVQVAVTARTASRDELTAKDYRSRTYTSRIKIRNR